MSDRPTDRGGRASTANSAGAGSSPGSAGGHRCGAAGYGLSLSTRLGASSTAARAPRPRSRSRRAIRSHLVVVELAGGNDGLEHRRADADPDLPPRCGRRSRSTDADRSRRLRRPAPEADQAGRRATRPGRSRSSRASATRTPTSRTSRRSRTGGRAPRATRHARAGSAATSTHTVGFDDPLAGVVHRARAVARVARERSFATTHRRRLRPPTRLPAWIDTPDDLVEAWSQFAPATRRPLDAARARSSAPSRLTGDARTPASTRTSRRRARAHRPTPRRPPRDSDGTATGRASRPRRPSSSRRRPAPGHLRDASVTTTPTRVEAAAPPGPACADLDAGIDALLHHARPRGRRRPGRGDDRLGVRPHARPRTAAAPTTAPPPPTSSSARG